MQAELVDFSTTPLASSCTGFYAKIIDNAFTPAECEELLNVATLGPEGWKPAGAQAEKDTYRNSARALVFDENVSKRIFDRLKPFVEAELGRIEPYGQWAGITGDPGRNEGPVWALDSVNPRLSFLRYGPGQYFKPHWDGQIVLEDGALKSFVTLQLYLSDNMTTGNIVEVDDAPVPGSFPAELADNGRLAGGATRFWCSDIERFLDVEPKIGRVLVFQHRMMLHSGEEVTSGVKYAMRSDFLFREVVDTKMATMK